jgi:transcriptional regulator with XRE-family HTH domain
MAKLRVREIAEARGWNAARLARKADLSNTAMYGIWNGTTEDPGFKTLEAIANALGVKIRDLIDENGDHTPGATIDENIETPMLAGALGLATGTR